MELTFKCKLVVFGLTALFLMTAQAGPQSQCDAIAKGLKVEDELHLTSPVHLLKDPSPEVKGGGVQVVIEIPAGSLLKWEVDKKTGGLKWDEEKGKPRVIRYLPYPGNYGMIPQSLYAKSIGGDGDPLDVLVLGPSVPRGTLLKAKVIGVLKLLDRREKDDKLIAVSEDSAFAQIKEISELKKKFPGILEIVETWFSHYKGKGLTVSKGYRGSKVATQILKRSIKAYTPK